MSEMMNVATIARLMQWHPAAQSHSARMAWARGIATLLRNTECDPLYLSVKWGVDRQLVCYWRDLGNLRGVYDQREKGILMQGWYARSVTLHRIAPDVHDSRCPCEVSGYSADIHSGSYDV